MTRRTRLFLVGSGGILVLGLGTGVLASYMGVQTGVIGGNGPADLAYLPRDVQAVAYANVRDVLDSELRSKLMSLRPDAPDATPDPDPDPDGPHAEARDFFAATGVDLERDVDSVIASFGSVDSNKHQPLVVARGSFNNGLIEAAILEHARERDGSQPAPAVETYKGTRLVVIPEGNDGSLAVAFAEPGVLVLGAADGVRRALDAKTSGDNIFDNDELMGLVRDSDDGNAWAVARFDALAGRAQLPPEIASRLPAISWFAVTGHVNGGLRARLRAETRDDASAQNLREVIQGLMALGRLQAGQNVAIEGLLNSLQLGGTGKTVSLGFTVDSDVIDALGLLIPQAPRRQIAPPAAPIL